MTKTYGLVGTGSRAFMYIDALIGESREQGTLVGLCDSNPLRMKYVSDYIKNTKESSPPRYGASEFHRILREVRSYKVIVTSIDRTHLRYIAAAMDAGCDVITEKPLTIDVPKAEEIFRVVNRSGREQTVTFNYRYAPQSSKVMELLRNGMIGKVKSIHFEWLLDTVHGADYLYLGNRKRSETNRRSGAGRLPAGGVRENSRSPPLAGSL